MSAEDEVAIRAAEAYLSFGKAGEEHPTLPKEMRHSGNWPLDQKTLRKAIEIFCEEARVDFSTKDPNDSRFTKPFYERAFRLGLVEVNRTPQGSVDYYWGGGRRDDQYRHRGALASIAGKIEKNYAVHGFNGRVTVVECARNFERDEHECLGHATARELFASGILERKNLKLAVGAGRGVYWAAYHLVAPKFKIKVDGEVQLLSLSGNLFDPKAEGDYDHKYDANMIASHLVQSFDADVLQVKKIRHPLINDDGKGLLEKAWFSPENWREGRPNCVLMGIGVLRSGLEHRLIKDLDKLEISQALRQQFRELIKEADEMHDLYGENILADLVNRIFFVDIDTPTLLESKNDEIGYPERCRRVRRLIDQINEKNAVLSVKKRQLRDVSEHRIVVAGGIEKARAFHHLLTREFGLEEDRFHLCPTHIVTTKEVAERLLEIGIQPNK